MSELETTPKRLVLASASPARAATLTQAGLAFTTVVSDVDEEELVRSYRLSNPAETALLLARAKAEAVAAQSPNALVLGCDSVFELDGKPYGKPYEEDVARERLRMMSSRQGVLHTGHWLIDTYDDGSRASLGELASASLTFAELSEELIDAYVKTGEPLQVAGSFTIDGRGAAFIDRVEGDPHTIVGLSVSTLRRLLAKVGVPIQQFWT